jgi:hypothetical protein
MNWQNIATAILLEALFKAWSGENYELFHNPMGNFPGIGTPRQIFKQRVRSTLVTLKEAGVTHI